MINLSLGPWGWIIAGLVLVGVEVLAPGAFMLWLGVAAIATGVITFVVTLSGEATALLFAALAIGAVAVGRHFMRDLKPKAQDRIINDRGGAMVGRLVMLTEPIAEGRGRVRIDDTVWRVEGPDLPSGTEVKVVGVDGTLLRVAPAR
ncbi:membrane protein [Alsobacter metallidurans]|uniref:Membrane protein n=1 Tax=Alsobacter metallidurans TaxID=340221 RepID=A0A917MJ86_9HYPH|nr:NfeD family protein [Alsobacter metallidurans]GGH30402.1 membrane protein [Alsobacter metallidurans]